MSQFPEFVTNWRRVFFKNFDHNGEIIGVSSNSSCIANMPMKENLSSFFNTECVRKTYYLQSCIQHMATKKKTGHIQKFLKRSDRAIDEGIKRADEILDDAVEFGSTTVDQAKEFRDDLRKKGSKKTTRTVKKAKKTAKKTARKTAKKTTRTVKKAKKTAKKTAKSI